MSTLSDPTTAHNTVPFILASTLLWPADAGRPASRFIAVEVKALRVLAQGAAAGAVRCTAQTLIATR